MMDFLKILVDAYDTNPNIALNLLNNMDTITGFSKDPQIIINFLKDMPLDTRSHKIATIKHVRKHTGLCLLDAKNLVERLIPNKPARIEEPY